MREKDLDKWVAKYRKAWESNDPADIAALPFPRLAQQVVWVHHREIGEHEVDDEIIQR